MHRRPGRRPLRFAAAALWSPKSISGLKLWLRADLGITIGTGVSAWADQSGTGDANKNVTQAVAGQQPAYTAADAAYNNKSTLTFVTASSQYLASGTWAAALAQPYTWFVVGNQGALTGSAQCFIEGDISGANRSLLYDNAGALEHFAGASLTGVARGTAAMVFGGDGNGGSSTIYKSAITAAATGNAGTNGITATTIAATFGGGSAFLGGKIAEVVIYSGVLSTANRTTLLNYFGTRYGITIGP